MAIKDTTTVKGSRTHEKKPKEVKESAETHLVSRYFSGVGRRKTAVARIRISENLTGEDQSEITVNDKQFSEYFQTQSLQSLVLAPLRSVGLENRYRVSIHVRGGGLSGQASASSLGIARALVVSDLGHRPLLKSGGFLSRDSRKVERKKPGLKKARRAPQWSKR